MVLNRMDFVKKLRSKGFIGVVKAVFTKLYARAYLYQLQIPTSLMIPETKLKLEPLTMNRLEPLYQMYFSEVPKSTYQALKKRLDNDSTDKTYLIVDELNQVYGYYHIAFAGCEAACTEFQIETDPQTVYLFDDYTFKRWRGLGAHKVSILFRLQLVAKLGYTGATAVIRKGNRHSEQAYQKAGFIKVKEFTYFNLILFRRTIAREIK